MSDHDTFLRTWGARPLSQARRRPGFDLDAAWLTGRWGSGAPRCEVSGHAFTAERVENALVKHPFAPSLDQIVPGSGYSKTNTRVVCVLVNFAMNQWGERYLRDVVESMVKNDPGHLLENTNRVWTLTMAARIDEAARAAAIMSGETLAIQRRRLAGLRAAQKKG